jgi:hypothetical protein
MVKESNISIENATVFKEAALVRYQTVIQTWDSVRGKAGVLGSFDGILFGAFQFYKPSLALSKAFWFASIIVLVVAIIGLIMVLRSRDFSKPKIETGMKEEFLNLPASEYILSLGKTYVDAANESKKNYIKIEKPFGFSLWLTIISIVLMAISICCEFYL